MQKRLMWLENNGYINNKLISHTRTTRFLMPLIGISEHSIGHINNKMFINAHIQPDRLICIILNKLDYPEESNDYLQIQYLNEHFLDHIEEEEEYILIYKVPEHFYEDYDKILNGKYSKTTTSYKEIITRIYGVSRNFKDHIPTIYDALEPTKEKRIKYAEFLGVKLDLIDEVSSTPDLNYEIYKNIKELTDGQ